MVGIIVVDVMVLINTNSDCTPLQEEGKLEALNLSKTVIKALALYLVLTVIRGTSTFVMKPLMRQKSKQFDVTYKEVLVSTKNKLPLFIIYDIQVAYCVICVYKGHSKKLIQHTKIRGTKFYVNRKMCEAHTLTFSQDIFHFKTIRVGTTVKRRVKKSRERASLHHKKES